MGWTLIWLTLSGTGAPTSGSAHFATVEACFAAQRAYGGLNFDITKGRLLTLSSESICVNDQTGEGRTAIQPRP
jgi:hypothetical protein